MHHLVGAPVSVSDGSVTDWDKELQCSPHTNKKKKTACLKPDGFAVVTTKPVTGQVPTFQYITLIRNRESCNRRNIRSRYSQGGEAGSHSCSFLKTKVYEAKTEETARFLL